MWLLEEPFLWAYIMNKPSSLKELVYSVHDGCSLQQKLIHHERENTMLLSSISLINGQLFLRCSILWWQICWTDYRTIFEELSSENKSIFALRKRWRVHLFPVLDLLIKCLVTKLRTKPKHVVVFKFYWEMDRNEKYWIKNARGRSNLCLSRIFILLES